MTKRNPKTYEAEFNGRKTRVTVPEDTDAETNLFNVSDFGNKWERLLSHRWRSAK